MICVSKNLILLLIPPPENQRHKTEIIASANLPYLIGPAQQDRPNAYERRLNGCRKTVIYDPGAQHSKHPEIKQRKAEDERAGFTNHSPSP